MGVKSTQDLTLEDARALLRSLLANDPDGDERLLEHIEGDLWYEDPIIDCEFLRMIRSDEEIVDLETVSGSIEHVLEAAYDMAHDGEGYRNFSLCFGEGCRSPRPLDPGNLIDLGMMLLIEVGKECPAAQPSM